jgi:ribosomal 50S subunit-recycling heat shock protein
MRLDKYLKVSRIIKRRSVANELCDAGRVSVNGRPARASYGVAPGDVLEMTMGERTVRARILATEEKTGKDMARGMYELLEG